MANFGCIRASPLGPAIRERPKTWPRSLVFVIESTLVPLGRHLPLLLVGFGLSWALPVAGGARVPSVELARISVHRDRATAPLRDGGTAELTILPALQRTADVLLGQARPMEGAIVAIEARNGRVLVFSEYHRDGRAESSALTTARAPAASLFKIVTAAALLERGVDPKTTVCTDGGSGTIELRHLAAPDGRAACGPFRQALGQSRNAAFAQLGTRYLNRSRLLDTAERLGFNGFVPFDVQVPVGTLEVADDPLGFGRTTAGFIGSKLSPLGAAHLAYTIALRGRPASVHIVRRAGDYEAPARRRELGRVLHEGIAIELRRMMEGTVHSGTSLSAFTDESGRSYLGSLRVAAKTGTLRPRGSATTTSWFAAFAPSRNPRLVVSVLMQNGPVWRRKASEVGRDVLRAYFASHQYRGVTDPLATRVR